MDYEEQEVRLSGEAPKKRPQRPAEGRRPASAQQRSGSSSQRSQQAPHRRPAADGQQKRPAAPSAAAARPAAKKRPAPAGSGSRFADDSPKRQAPRTAAGTRSASGQRRPAQGAHTAARSAAAGSHSRTAEARTAAAGTRKVSKWRIGMTIYIILFIIFLLLAMRWIWVLCSEFEDSQPKYTIDAYVTELNGKDAAAKEAYFQDMLKQKIDVLPLSQYETSDSIYNTLDIEESAETKFSWIKSKRYTEEAPVYYIRSGEAVIAEVELAQNGTTKKHDFNLWTIGKINSMLEVASEPEYDFTATFPAGASISINGIAVDAASIQPAAASIKLDEASLKYSAQPDAQTCTISGLYAAPVITVTDANGTPLSPTEEPKEGAKHQELVFEPADQAEIDPDIVSRTEALTAAYINYMINEGYATKGDAATWENLGVLDRYMINGSTLYQNMHQSVGELNWNNAYTSRKDSPIEISHLKMYSDTCCTVEAKYAYELTKTRDGVTNVNNYAGTIRWTLVKVDGVWYTCGNVLVQSSEGGTHSNVGV